jgi:hypothetical protein
VDCDSVLADPAALEALLDADDAPVVSAAEGMLGAVGACRAR